ncbi:bile acid:sodium symporter family protein [Flagellimonas nanhaiensis]|uniref:Bile acid:sodium symporter family protein n=1 Tax=Flagellimonas nanhaiensis TaxID=2292706 RepID=A0A371JRR0_9FLAO|nr:bile acid:sodium symporter family protein [Allomuricauda nanhaiensis]RDY60184.1 bile acid:sodium symporter family protein [Allomuricauda nanhaiensis]
MKAYSKLLLGVSSILAIILIVMLVLGMSHQTGVAVIGFFLSLAIAFQGISALKGFSYTILIFAAVSASLYYPDLFTEIGDFNLKRLIVPLLMLIMFGMGTAMSLKDFVGVIKMPKGVLVGIICQFTIMPFVGLGLTYAFNLPPEVAAGVILVGCSPSGLASNVMAYISGANLPLSLTLTAVATLLAPLMTPFLMKLLADQLVPIDFLGMLWSIMKLVILPIIAGLIFNKLAHGRFKWLDKAMPIVSMAGIAIIITVITAAGRDSLLTIGLTLILVVIIHNATGYFLGYWGSRLSGLDEKSARTVAFEVGMQNAGLASGIALEMNRIATMGLAPAVFGPWMNISGSSLATWWRDSTPIAQKENTTKLD